MSHLCLQNTLRNRRPAGLISMGAAKLPVKANKCKSCLAIKANSSNSLAPGFNLEHKSFFWQSERKHSTFTESSNYMEERLQYTHKMTVRAR